jgi:hypothetical protein
MMTVFNSFDWPKDRAGQGGPEAGRGEGRARRLNPLLPSRNGSVPAPHSAGQAKAAGQPSPEALARVWGKWR